MNHNVLCGSDFSANFPLLGWKQIRGIVPGKTTRTTGRKGEGKCQHEESPSDTERFPKWHDGPLTLTRKKNNTRHHMTILPSAIMRTSSVSFAAQRGLDLPSSRNLSIVRERCTIVADSNIHLGINRLQGIETVHGCIADLIQGHHAQIPCVPTTQEDRPHKPKTQQSMKDRWRAPPTTTLTQIHTHKSNHTRTHIYIFTYTKMTYTYTCSAQSSTKRIPTHHSPGHQPPQSGGD